jgi:hypothetical protein
MSISCCGEREKDTQGDRSTKSKNPRVVSPWQEGLSFFPLVPSDEDGVEGQSRPTPGRGIITWANGLCEKAQLGVHDPVTLGSLSGEEEECAHCLWRRGKMDLFFSCRAGWMKGSKGGMVLSVRYGSDAHCFGCETGVSSIEFLYQS